MRPLNNRASGLTELTRPTGVLTWALIHRIEAKVLTEIATTGECMLRAPVALDYPRDERPVLLEGHGLVPPALGEIDKAWRRLNQRGRSEHCRSLQRLPQSRRRAMA